VARHPHPADRQNDVSGPAGIDYTGVAASPIDLIDGDRLCELLKQYDLGVRDGYQDSYRCGVLRRHLMPMRRYAAEQPAGIVRRVPRYLIT
jgi:hypothetical protein